MMAAPIYRHPDGEGNLQFDAATSRLFLFNAAEGLSAYALIGPWGLRDVAAKLLALADADTTERAGAELGHALLAELLALRGHPQSEAFRAVRDKLTELHKLEHFDSAAGGFAAAIVNTLEVGVFHLPQFEGDCP